MMCPRHVFRENVAKKKHGRQYVHIKLLCITTLTENCGQTTKPIRSLIVNYYVHYSVRLR